MITDIFEDSRGNFWFGSHGDGLCRYDGKQYTYYTVDNGLPNGTVREIAPGPDWSKTRKINGGNQIGSIQEDKNGHIWFGNGDNIICKFDGQAFSPVHSANESTLLTNRSDKEWKTELEYMWFGRWDKLGVYRYDGNKLEHLTFPLPYGSHDDGVSEVYKDNEGNIWFGTMDNGTFRYTGESFTRINKNDEIGICRSVFQDNTGRIWITNNRFGLSYLEGDTLTIFSKDYVQSIEQDKNGDLWFGTFANGLLRYDGKKLDRYTNDNGLPIVTVKTIYKDKSGKLWFGIGEGTVYGFNGESFYRFDGKESIK
jgi:ligand-binding sensor domain-containing protein